jgi:hypothetical protein
MMPIRILKQFISWINNTHFRPEQLIKTLTTLPMTNFKLFLYGLTGFIILLVSGCTDSIYYENTVYHSISSTKAAITLDYRIVGNTIVSNVFAKLTDIDDMDNIKIINDMGNATIQINGSNMVYGTIDGVQCFHPADAGFKLFPDSVYHVTITDSTGIYDSYVQVPQAFDNIKIQDTLDISKGINITWTSSFPTYKIHAYVEIYNPTSRSEKMVLIDDELAENDKINVANTMSPFVDGWIGKITVDRRMQGLQSLLLHQESRIIAKSSYIKQFIIRKKQ